MDTIQAFMLSVVEGITEFLPISSTGHLILASKLMGVTQTDFVKSFEIIIQFGAILAVAVLFLNKIRKTPEVWPKILVAFLPTVVVGFTLYKLIKNILMGNSMVTVISLVAGGIIFIIFETMMKNKKSTTTFHTMSYAQALIIGMFQAVSVIPGVSRAAATIVGGMMQGLSREDAVEFSFFLAIPTIAAASGYDILKSGMHWSQSEMILLAIGCIGAFISALVTVTWFIRFVKKHTFIPFAYYRIVVGILFWFIVLR